MGTFGTGAFSSDGALDLLEDLAKRSPDRRASALERLFQFVKESPELLWKEFFPDEVVAAAAIVATSLPGGQYFSERLEELVENDVSPDVRLSAAVPELAGAALEALLFVAGPDGPWHQGWTSDTYAAEARGEIEALTGVLKETGVEGPAASE